MPTADPGLPGPFLSAVSRPLTLAEHLATAADVPIEILYQLHALHLRQWQLEDDTRSKDATAAQIASSKRKIDASNTRRHQLIDTIDESLTWTPSAASPRFYSETVGELCDRLLILDLKHQALSVRAGQHDTDGASDGTTAGIEHACRHLWVAVAQLLDDLAAGCAVLPPRIGVKVYNGETSYAVETPQSTASHAHQTGASGRVSS